MWASVNWRASYTAMKTRSLTFLLLAIFITATGLILLAQSPQQPSQQPMQSQKPGVQNPVGVIDEKPIPALPYTPSLDVNAMDKSADPCADFYQYSCGGWMKRNLIPPDQASWSVYGKLYNDNQKFLWGILDDLSKKIAGRNPTQQKIGDYFGACMDEAAVERRGAEPLKPALDEIARVQNKRDLAPLLAHQHLATTGNGLLFGFGSDQDFSNSNEIIAFATAGGLGLPDRDYYTKDDAKSKELRDKYVQHVARMMQLLGSSEADAKSEADKIMAVETALAKASLTRVERRDPYKLFHKMSRQE